jgi:hypothetical protein
MRRASAPLVTEDNMADTWVQRYIAKIQKSLKARTGEESMQEKHAKKKKKKKGHGGNNKSPGISNTVKYN